MKILKDGTQVFYAKAGRSFSGLVFFLVLSAVFGGVCFVTTNDFLLKSLFALLSLAAALMFFYILSGMIIKKPLVSVGRDYLLIGYRIFFNEIEGLYKYSYSPANIEMIEVKVKDQSKYPPTVMQKFALQAGHPLFSIAVGMMAADDAKALEVLLGNIMPLQQGRNR
ncbi:MAG: hypothetical protein LBG16_02645 [Elusimicrobiota bacterium]|jgi:hypothetical protein|nr:hypothetical protein [Elusimicrobiota bacterium]